MAKGIKRIGMIFFVLVLSCLLVLGCVLSINADKNNNVSELNNTIVDASEAQEFVPDITLTGSSENKATLWASAITSSINNNREIKVLLQDNWVAPTTVTNHAFGSGTGFTSDGCIFVPANAKIYLELQGNKIDRGLTKATVTTNGRVFQIEGSLTITDSTYNADTIEEIYVKSGSDKQFLDMRIRALPMGMITGGASNSVGAISVDKSTGVLNIYGGMIGYNYASGNGAALGVSNSATVNMYNGLIYGNVGDAFGGGVYVLGGTFEMHNGFIMNNTANNYGAGIQSYGNNGIRGKVKIYNGIIAHNSGQYGAGVSICRESEGEMLNGEIAYNNSSGNSAGLLVWESDSKFDMYNGKIHHNRSVYISSGATGGTGILSSTEINVYGGEVTDNIYDTAKDDVIVYGAGIYIANGTAKLQNVTITRNEIVSIVGDGLHSYGGGVSFKGGKNFEIGANVNIFDNFAHGVPSDLRIEKNGIVNIIDSLAKNGGTSKIGIKFADDYGTGIFTKGYSTNNSGNPSEYFFSNDGVKLATLNAGEVSFEKTIESEEYDFVYFENNKRYSYKDNNLIHAVNDYAKSKQANDGILVLGNIAPNTSINTFISNIAFESTNIQLYDLDNNLIYDKGNSVAGISISEYDNGNELAIGTGWKLITYNGNVKIEEFKLSVLGDINGDGRISASDITTIREIANDRANAIFNNLKVEQKLACLIINKGIVTTADSEILLNVINKKLTIDLFY